MPEYIEREALIKAGRAIKLKDICPDWNVPKVAKALEQQGQTFLKLIKEAPTADVVEVARCKDCEHKKEIPDCQKELYSSSCVACSYHSGLIMDGNDFCSYGTRKEGVKSDL